MMQLKQCMNQQHSHLSADIGRMLIGLLHSKSVMSLVKETHFYRVATKYWVHAKRFMSV